MRHSIIFGNASYLANGVVKIRENKAKTWEKAPYVAMINGLDTTHGLARNFIQKKVEVSDAGKPVTTWTLPLNYTGVLECGWFYSNMCDIDFAQTFYIMCLGEKGYIEITEAQAYREMQLKIKKAMEVANASK